MNVIVSPCELESIQHLRGLFREETNYQIVRDSILGRGLADPYGIAVDGTWAGYGGIWNNHFRGRVMEYYVHPAFRFAAKAGFERLLQVSKATHVEAQTNIPHIYDMFQLFADDVKEENILFNDGPATALSVPRVDFRRRRPGDHGPDGEWVVERKGVIVGAGGILTHYNPPFGDLYMAVVEHARREGIGSYLVQELKRTCVSLGLTPAARCDPGNEASRRALLRGGLVECGRIVSGGIRNPLPGSAGDSMTP